MARPVTAGAEVRGIPQARRKLDRLADTTDDLSVAHRSIAPRLVARVASLTRKRTGQLAGAWRQGISPRAASITNAEPYAGPQESGWPARGIEPTLAVPQAIDEQTSTIVDDYDAEISRQIRAIDGGP